MAGRRLCGVVAALARHERAKSLRLSCRYDRLADDQRLIRRQALNRFGDCREIDR
jgi:hypothetical protein